MYTEGFEGLEEAEKESRRTYGSSSEVDRLIRENNKLKESLEKEKFFNKLLDQEIQELKTALPNGARQPYNSEYWSGNRKVSRGAFYTLLFVTLLMAAYIGYGIYYDKKFSYLRNISMSSVPAAPAAEQDASVITDSVPNIVSNNKSTTEASVPTTNTPAATPPAAAAQKSNAEAAAEKRKPVTADEQYDEEEVNAAINEPTRPAVTQRTRSAQTAGTQATLPATQTTSQNRPAAGQNNPTTAQTNSAGTQTNAPVTQSASENRPVLAKYKITSKANFYNNPDENSMRGTFISASGDKVVSALEDKNGFIYVEYTNDLGFTSKGWLSKQDLTKE